eukprot:766653-Hanusia_phi.AAC.5
MNFEASSGEHDASGSASSSFPSQEMSCPQVREDGGEWEQGSCFHAAVVLSLHGGEGRRQLQRGGGDGGAREGGDGRAGFKHAEPTCGQGRGGGVDRQSGRMLFPEALLTAVVLEARGTSSPIPA